MKQVFEEVQQFHEMLNEQRCGSREKNQEYLETVLALFLGYFLGHALGFFLFPLS